MEQARPDAVLLVHGTFAASKRKCDTGRRWWQRSASTRTFLNWLNARLDGVAACERVFHWSGENKEQERRRAGRELLEVMDAYEAEGRSYHLVGHSHGGSVIWCALREAARRAKGASQGDPLPNLRSWTTVGTPFLTYGVRWSDLLYAVPLLITGYLLPNLLGQMQVVSRYFGSLWFPPQVPASHHAGLVGLGLVHLFGLLLLALVIYRAAGRWVLRRSRLPVDFWRRWDVLVGMGLLAIGALVGAYVGSARLGVYEAIPAATQANRRALVGLLLSWAVVGVVFLYALYRIAIVLYAAWMCARDDHADWLASRAFRDRGRCLWSREDEAINGLRTTLQLHDLRRTPDDGSDDLDEPAPDARPQDGNGHAAVTLPAADEPVRILPRKGLASAVFAPLVDQFFFEVLKQFLQGNDLMGRRLAAVTAEPPGAPESPALPDALQDALEQQVTDGIIHVPTTLHRLRRVLGAVAYGGQLQSPFEGGPGQAPPVHTALMIHTMYFPEATGAGSDAGPPIPSLIARRIASRSQRQPAHLADLGAPWALDEDGPSGHATAVLPRLVAPGTLERARLKASLVPLSACAALSAVLLLPALTGSRLFDRVLPYTAEGRVNAMVSAASGVVHDAAADSEAFPYLADWGSALADAAARGPLRTAESGSLERRVVPAVRVSQSAAREAIEEIDDDHVRADVAVSLAERLASAPTTAPARASAMDLARSAVEAANRAHVDHPDIAADVVVRAAAVSHALGDDTQARAWLNDAATRAIAEINAQFLKLKALDRDIQQDSATPAAMNVAPDMPNEADIPARPEPDLVAASVRENVPAFASDADGPLEVVSGSGEAMSREDDDPGRRLVPAEAPPAPRPYQALPYQVLQPLPPEPARTGEPQAEQPATVMQLDVPMVFAGMGFGMESRQQALANRLVPILLRASVLWQAIDATSGASKALVEDLLRAYRNAESMAAAKGGSVRFWQFGPREGLMVASRMKELGLAGWEAYATKPGELPWGSSAMDAAKNWWTLADRPGDPVAAAVSPAHALEVLGLMDELASRAEVMAAPLEQSGPTMMRSPEYLAGYVAFMAAMGGPEEARRVAGTVLELLGEIQPHPEELYRAGFSNELYAGTYQRAVDRHAMRRIMLRLDLARLGLSESGPLSPRELIDASWNEAVAISSRAARLVEVLVNGLSLVQPQAPGAPVQVSAPGGDVPAQADRLDPWQPDALEQVSRASAIAGVLATASHLDPKRADTAAIQTDLLGRYQALVRSDGAALAEEAVFCPPLGRALRHLARAFAVRGDLAAAETVASLIDETRQRVSSRLLIASQLVRGTEDERKRARAMLIAAEQEITAIERRRDRSPRLAECAALWAMLGEPSRAIAAREECRLVDRLQADATILGWFALPPGGTPTAELADLFDPPPVFDPPSTGAIGPLAPAMMAPAPAPMAPPSAPQ